jgi:HD superfamily phosphohydrolase
MQGFDKLGQQDGSLGSGEQGSSEQPNLFRSSISSYALGQGSREEYCRLTGKDPQRLFLMRSVIDPENGIEFDPRNHFERVVLKLMDLPVIQRMKYISQTAAASWGFPDANHCRFQHIIGVSRKACDVINFLHNRSEGDQRKQIEEWGPVSVAHAMTHDVAHIAPGSHVAHGVWFPGRPDCHESMSHQMLKQLEEFRYVVEVELGEGAAERLDRVAAEDASVPPWTWQLITAGGWNADRADWVQRDGVMCGVNYGRYEYPIIKKNLRIASDGNLVIREEGLSALESFFSARFQMYRNVYGHSVCRTGELMYELVGRRARTLFRGGELALADDTMKAVLAAEDASNLDLQTVLRMTEYWWQYHLALWSTCSDATLADLAQRVLHRVPFKSVGCDRHVASELEKIARNMGLDPQYYVQEIPSRSVDLTKDLQGAIKVLRANGDVVPLAESSQLMHAYQGIRKLQMPALLVAPQEVFARLPTQ